MDDVQRYLEPTPSVESDHPRVVELAERITAGSDDPSHKARLLFLHVRDSIKYSLFNPFSRMEDYRATAILERGRGYCVQKAVVLAALARASGIPARLVFADLINHRAAESMRRLMSTNLFTYHCYVEMHLGGRWVKAVPAFDKGLCQEHDYPLVEFDGHRDALFPPRDERGRRYMEYVRHHGRFADVPIEPMLKAWEEAYGKERVEFWKQASLSMPAGGEPPSGKP